ncbi:hypothetical protein [Vibrio owensii]|uniref:hypothetical protein n=1 Tax=Vibrio harveyi group TaxID=717610 RepID=UPI003CC574CC
MWNKKYLVVSVDGREEVVSDLADVVRKFGLRSFKYLFGNGFECKKISIHDSYEDVSEFRFFNSDGLASTCKYVVFNMQGKIIPVNQILSEFLNDFPLDPEVKELEGFYSRLYFRDNGAARFKRTRKGGRGSRIPKYRHYHVCLEDEVHEEVKVQLVRPKHKNFVMTVTDWYEDYPRTHTQKNWKKFRKTQYK